MCVCFGVGGEFKKINNKIKYIYVFLFFSYVCCRGREFVFTVDREDQYKYREEVVVVLYFIIFGGFRGKIGGYVKFFYWL